MRSRLALGAAVLSLAAVSAGGVAVAASGDEAEPKTIVVATHQIDFAVGVHAGAPGSPPETAGDTIVIRQQLRNAAGDAAPIVQRWARYLGTTWAGFGLVCAGNAVPPSRRVGTVAHSAGCTTPRFGPRESTAAGRVGHSLGQRKDVSRCSQGN